MKIKYWLYRKFPPFTNFLFRKKRKGFSIKTHVEIPYHSQYGQDKIINERIFGSKRNGFFVDIGANDGITGSNTYFFEKEMGWSGICIEPQSDIFSKLRENRIAECVNCAVADSNGKRDFLKVGHADMLSGLTENLDPKHIDRILLEGDPDTTQAVSVECKRFADIIGSQEIIDFLSIDTEGSEFEILKSINFNKVRFRCIAVENNYQNRKIYDFLKSKGYKLKFVAGDEIYVGS
jgi:FkbM family methyltransferase